MEIEHIRLCFANRLRTLRKINNISRKELASIVGVSETRVICWEEGKGITNVEELAVLAELFGISVDDLIGYERYTIHVDFKRKDK